MTRRDHFLIRNANGRVREVAYHLRFRWEEEMELQPGWKRASWEIPVWAQRPGADIMGTWRTLRRRVVWLFGIPVTPWLRCQ